jgi:hypothetical protein
MFAAWRLAQLQIPCRMTATVLRLLRVIVQLPYDKVNGQVVDLFTRGSAGILNDNVHQKRLSNCVMPYVGHPVLLVEMA